MSITVTLPEVESCAVNLCVYNAAGTCHAPAVTIGSSIPHCDTFLPAPAPSPHVGRRLPSGVGACKATACRHNRELTCAAGSIQVGSDDIGGVCLTMET